MRVLICGGSGYLGQILLRALNQQGHTLTFTHASHSLACPPQNTVGCKVDLVTGAGLDEAFSQHGPFDAVINCAALSQPGACQKDPELARGVNVPDALLKCLQQQGSMQALLIHLSTDQVYDGTRAWWTEADACAPVNVYGDTKLKGEQAIQREWKHHVILRSSIIFGAEPPEPVDRALFLQWLDKALGDTQAACPTFFDDEWRCPTYVEDILAICSKLLQKLAESKDLSAQGLTGVYNMGGPDRLSRLDMAHQVAEVRGHDASRIVGAASATVSRPVQSPQDISMKSDRLESALGIKMTPFKDALRHLYSC